jgi:carbonic anhydrase/acetyltransferase-like protein (isoleucine patch superfamily)
MQKELVPVIENVETGRVYPFQGIVPDIHPSCFLAAGSHVIGNVTLEENVSVWFNVVIRGDVERIVIKKNSNIQDNATIHVTHFKNPTLIGENVTIGHGAVIHGCTIGDGALVGMNAVVLDRAVVGKGSLIAAGSVVTPNTVIPDGVLAAGIPAKVIRTLTERDAEFVALGAENYVMYVQHFRGEVEDKDWYVGKFAGE